MTSEFSLQKVQTIRRARMETVGLRFLDEIENPARTKRRTGVSTIVYFRFRRLQVPGVRVRATVIKGEVKLV